MVVSGPEIQCTKSVDTCSFWDFRRATRSAMRQHACSVLDASLSNVVFFGVFFAFFGVPAKRKTPKNKSNNNQPTPTSTLIQQQQKQHINNHKSTTQLKINYNQSTTTTTKQNTKKRQKPQKIKNSCNSN